MTECPMCHHIFDKENDKKIKYKNELIETLIKRLKELQEKEQ